MDLDRILKASQGASRTMGGLNLDEMKNILKSHGWSSVGTRSQLEPLIADLHAALTAPAQRAQRTQRREAQAAVSTLQASARAPAKLSKGALFEAQGVIYDTRALAYEHMTIRDLAKIRAVNKASRDEVDPVIKKRYNRIFGNKGPSKSVGDMIEQLYFVEFMPKLRAAESVHPTYKVKDTAYYDILVSEAQFANDRLENTEIVGIGDSAEFAYMNSVRTVAKLLKETFPQYINVIERRLAKITARVEDGASPLITDSAEHAAFTLEARKATALPAYIIYQNYVISKLLEGGEVANSVFSHISPETALKVMPPKEGERDTAVEYGVGPEYDEALEKYTLSDAERAKIRPHLMKVDQRIRITFATRNGAFFVSEPHDDKVGGIITYGTKTQHKSAYYTRIINPDPFVRENGIIEEIRERTRMYELIKESPDSDTDYILINALFGEPELVIMFTMPAPLKVVSYDRSRDSNRGRAAWRGQPNTLVKADNGDAFAVAAERRRQIIELLPVDNGPIIPTTILWKSTTPWDSVVGHLRVA